MRIVIDEPPENEPVDLETAKTYARVDNDSDDDLMNMFITSARTWCEAYCGRSFITQTLSVFYDFDEVCKNTFIRLPISPVQSIDSLVAYNEDGDDTEISEDDYYLSGDRLIFKVGIGWPNDMRYFDSFAVNAIVGFGDEGADVPMPIREAILRLVAHIYQNREAMYDSVNGSWNGKNAPHSVTALLMPYRVFVL
jgi:uncharacterized phiE125 gp8 family phage protein